LISGAGSLLLDELLFDEDEPRPMAVNFDEKRVSPWRAPIERQLGIAELTVRTFYETAGVVKIFVFAFAFVFSLLALLFLPLLLPVLVCCIHLGLLSAL
jgi:hypothetical protein